MSIFKQVLHYLKITFTYCLGLNALKCYKCVGKNSNCERKSITCQAGLDRCVKIDMKGNGREAVVKSCLLAPFCTNITAYCDLYRTWRVPDLECKATCCSGDNCNLSSKNSQVVFGIIVFGVLAAIMLK